jgi:hypothetical protein
MSEELTSEDAVVLLDALDELAYAVDQYVDEDGKPHPYIWDDYGKALDVLRLFGRRDERAF